MRGLILTAVALKDMALDGRRDERARLDSLFAGTVDPMGFDRPAEALRFRRAEELLDQVTDNSSFHRALEIGCAEGHFTERLATRCQHLMAVDISPTAVARAHARCRHYGHVGCAVWNLRHDPVPGSFDLIVSVGVLEYIRSPFTLRAVRDKLVSALSPGGHLLAGTTVSPFDDTWAGRLFLRGTWIHGFLAQDPRLSPVAISRDDCAKPFEHVLYRKCPDLLDPDRAMLGEPDG
jgi:SAM-dependent methyltransferase